MWVEPDCNIPSGESLLRQMLFAHRFCLAEFGVEPSIAWLPDTFGFARTLPTLLAHAGIRLFRDDEAAVERYDAVPAPSIPLARPGRRRGDRVRRSIEWRAAPTDARVRIARERGEPLIVGYGDGGGGPTEEQLREAATAGTWERPQLWFARLAERRDELPRAR